MPCTSSRTRGSSASERRTSPSIPCSAAHLPISTGSSVISAAGYGRRSPTTSACETNREVLRSFSRFCGAMFLPPAVTMMSFLRSVIVTKPSSSIVAMSPGAQPAVVAEHRGRRLGVLVVAGEDGLAADQELAVLGEPELEAGQRRPDGAEPVALGRVRRRGRRALRQAVALEDADADRVEELGDLLRERRAARDRRRAAARRGAPSPSRRRAGRRGGAGAASATRHGLALLAQRALAPCRRRAPSRSAGGARRSPRRTSTTTAVCTFSYTRGTLGSTVGRTSGIARATSSGSGRNAIV